MYFHRLCSLTGKAVGKLKTDSFYLRTLPRLLHPYHTHSRAGSPFSAENVLPVSWSWNMLSSLVGSEDPRFPTAESPSQGDPGDNDGRAVAPLTKRGPQPESPAQTGPGRTRTQQRTPLERSPNKLQGLCRRGEGQSRRDRVRRNTLENTALSFKE